MQKIDRVIKEYKNLDIVNAHNKMLLDIVAKANEFNVEIFKNPKIVNSFIDLKSFDKIPNELIKIVEWLKKSEKNAQISF